jgi:LacI family gluconate utilization system Gnt-I transcriptional repressor
VGRPVRVEDVAREAGVSPITVSRALNTPGKVRPLTRQRVLEAVARTGYVVNSIASSLRSGRSNIVAVFVSGLRNAHFANAVQGTLDAFEGSRFRLLFVQTGSDDELRPDLIESVVPFRPAGVIFTGVVRDPGARALLQALGAPVVEMWSDGGRPLDMFVSSSTREGGRLMGAYFGAQGHRRVVYCGHVSGRAAERLEGFRAGLAEHGAEIAMVRAVTGASSFAEGAAALDDVLAGCPGCEAIFFGTDIMAIGALFSARRRGIAVPHELSIAGYGDREFARLVEPPLTTIRVEDYLLGRRAGEMMLGRIEGAELTEPVIYVPVTLEVRGSTAPAKNAKMQTPERG